MPKFSLWTMEVNIQSSSKRISSYPSGATGPKLIILWSYRKLLRWSHYLRYSFLEDVDLSWLNCFLVDGQLNVLEGCMILVLWLKDFYIVVIKFISLHSQTVGIFWGTEIPYYTIYLKFYFYFAAIFVAFGPSWCFSTDFNFCLYQVLW